ncbi:dnaJ homolog subfamily C member 17 [Musca vetustissima]|uniref:dnaJ homolog subfamily C member 17 n=1 Tax=Musca vetustissima TaxID=27455 RepID=UPI002AB763D9|nr:dnaJ homolog subfamily C member 17 [Musca vetustissima]
MASANQKLSDKNLYEILGIDVDAQESEIRKAYRKKALECHPDKNPDNPKAAELFHELSKALEVLSDVAARAAYDKVWKARQAAEVRHRQLDSKRQKLKEDLERREKDALSNLFSKSHNTYKVQKTDEEILNDQIERLRREGSRLLEEEQRLLREQLQKSLSGHQNNADSTTSKPHRLKIKWNSNKKDEANGGYSDDILTKFMKKYGDIVAIVMSKKNGSALIEFKSREAAEMAMMYEKGLIENPLHIEWIDESSKSNDGKASQQTSQSTTLDYEDLVMRKLRQAEERKRLIEQMLKEDEDQ